MFAVQASIISYVHAQQPSPQRNVISQPDPSTSCSKQPLGRYYALVIGNNNYRNVPKLSTPINDAKEMAQILRDKYGFETRVLTDATRSDIISAIADYRQMLTPDSSLLIYYAGHGQKDRDTGEAYWLPVDAERGNSAQWISADDITTQVRAMQALHVLIISDSCYSGMLSQPMRGGDFDIDPNQRQAYIAKMLRLKSRNILASGGDEPVSDGGAQGHSIFAAVVLEALRDTNDSEFNGGQLFGNIQPRVGGRSVQLPQYSSILYSGHDGGDFIFFQHGSRPSALSCCQGTQTCGGGTKDSASQLNDDVNSLLGQYRSAYESGSASELARLWPGITSQRLKNLEAFFNSARSIVLNYSNVSLSSDGTDEVTVRFSQVLNYTVGGQSRSLNTGKIVMKLKRNPSGQPGWQIYSIQ
jgi:uncharacterized caspase-like protein